MIKIKDIIKLIVSAQKNDETALIELINDFYPLINKYYRMMGYDEDFKQDITLKFIEIIKFDVNLNKIKNINNYVIVKYIENTIYHHYIYLSKKKKNKIIMELNSDDELIINLFDDNENDNFKIIIIDMMKNLLTEREFLCVKMILLQGYTSEEVSNFLNITKQAVNQCKLKTLKKLKQFYYSVFEK